MILGIEVDHKGASLALRERISFRPSEIPAALEALLKGEDLEGENVLPPLCERENRDCAACSYARYAEAAILSTCNRTGLYALGRCPEPLARFLARRRNVPPEALRPHITVYENESAVSHLFAVAAGLESQVLGEPQILGQVRGAYEEALDLGAIGPVLGEFFRRAVQVGKRVRTETGLGRHPASLASVAVELAGRVHSDLSQLQALLVGTGEMGTQVARLLRKRGVKDLVVTSRDSERATELAREVDGRPVAFERLRDELRRVSVVISATASEGFVLTGSQVTEVLGSRNGRPLLFIDLGVPRNLDPDIRDLDSVILRDLDDLKAVSEEGQRRRKLEIPRAREIVREEIEAFMAWLREQRAVPLIKALHQRAEELRREQLDWALPKLGPLSADQRELIEALTRRLTKKLLHAPTEELKSLAHGAESCEPFTLAKRLFALDTDGDERTPESERIQRSER